MRASVLLRTLGALLLLLALALLACAAVALPYGGSDVGPCALAAGISAVVGAAGMWLGRRARRKAIHHREGFAIVTLGWVLAAAFGALPYFLWAHGVAVPGGAELRCAAPAEATGQPATSLDSPPAAEARPLGFEFCDYTNAYFETMSGLTTTGATIISAGLWPSPTRQVGLPHGLLFWRALTHWLGGMGIIVLSLAILPLLGVGGMQLYRAEVPGPTSDKLVPRVGQTARLLWGVYVLLSGAEFVLLLFGGLDPYVAATHTFGTLATGGFSVLAASAEGFHSPYVEWVTTAFMVAAGLNFALHYRALRGRPLELVRDPEARFFLGVFGGATLVIAAALWGHGISPGLEAAIRTAAFQVASILTTTGYASTDFELWLPVAPLAPVLLVLLMFVGGSAGSTGGGAKCVRVVLAAKMGYRELLRLVHPRAMVVVRLGPTVVGAEVLSAVVGFLLLYLATFIAGVLLLAGVGLDPLSAFTAAAASLGNIGPGLGGVGPYDNYLWLPAAGKWVCIVLMLMGRLEIYTVLVLLLPRIWSRSV